ncbi:MAG: hypothetical protein JSS66_06405 [Armatimonadetes bacterium]|nr:hypothetical protein [Armatimonadota bacterium]
MPVHDTKEIPEDIDSLIESLTLELQKGSSDDPRPDIYVVCDEDKNTVKAVLVWPRLENISRFWHRSIFEKALAQAWPETKLEDFAVAYSEREALDLLDIAR